MQFNANPIHTHLGLKDLIHLLNNFISHANYVITTTERKKDPQKFDKLYKLFIFHEEYVF